MACWRMKLRAGSHGRDMWEDCKKNGVAAITYNGVDHTDLTPYSKERHPPGWSQIKGPAAKGSLSLFAWRILGGDVI